MKIFFFLFALCALWGAISNAAHAESMSTSLPYAIRIEGREKVLVTTSGVRLEDIARVKSDSMEDSDRIIGLKKTYIADAPIAGSQLRLQAQDILRRLEEEGIDVRAIGYRFPSVVVIERASRQISREEVETTIREVLSHDAESTQLRQIEYAKPVSIAPGAMTLQAERFHTNKPGKASFRLLAQVEGEKPVEFTVQADVDEWVNVPVARRPLPKGTIVSPGDMVMARLRVSEVPADAAPDAGSIVGLETNNAIPSGEIFRKRVLIIPPLVQTGAKVSIVFRAKNFEASASGTTLGAGAEGQIIQVKNDASKKIVTGILQGDGSVLVQP